MSIAGAFMVPHPPLIVPEIGRGEENRIQDTVKAYQEVALRIGQLKPETIVLLSPHSTMYADYFHISPGASARGDFRQFGVGGVSVSAVYDTEFVEELCRAADRQKFNAGTLGERERKLDHGTMVPLYFINQSWDQYRLVRIGLSGLPFADHYVLGQLIARTADQLNRSVVVVASGDLSHKLMEDGPYGYSQEGPEYDRRIMEVMGAGAFGELFKFTELFCEQAGECGHRSFVIMAGALDCMDVIPERLSYQGPFGVGYGICAFQPCKPDPNRNFKERFEGAQRARAMELREGQDAYVQLARQALESYVCSGRLIRVPDGLPAKMKSIRAGAFVSLHMDGALRGCIGTIQASRSCVAEEIIRNAVSAGAEDPRFPPVTEDELDRLVYSVDVLGPTEPVESEQDLDVKRYGVIVFGGGRRGLLLPNLEGVDTVEQQIAIARRKAGIKPEEKVLLERFEVVRHE